MSSTIRDGRTPELSVRPLRKVSIFLSDLSINELFKIVFSETCRRNCIQAIENPGTHS